MMNMASTILETFKTRLQTDIKPPKEDKASLCLSWIIAYQLQTSLSLFSTIKKCKHSSTHMNTH